MKKSIQNLMMAAAMICGTMSMTSCDEFMESIFGEWDKPTPENSTPTPDPTPDPTSTVTTIELTSADLTAEQKAETAALLAAAQAKGATIGIKFSYDGVDYDALFEKPDGEDYKLTSFTSSQTSTIEETLKLAAFTPYLTLLIPDDWTDEQIDAYLDSLPDEDEGDDEGDDEGGDEGGDDDDSEYSDEISFTDPATTRALTRGSAPSAALDMLFGVTTAADDDLVQVQIATAEGAATTVGETGNLVLKYFTVKPSTSSGKINDEYAKSIKVIVNAGGNKKVKEVKLAPKKLNFYSGVPQKISVIVKPKRAKIKKISLTSKDGSVAKIAKDESGNLLFKVKPLNNGKTKMTVIVNGKRKTCKVTVNIQVDAVELNRTSLQLTKGETYQLKATVTATNNSQTVTWKSSNEKVANVDQEGNVTAVGAGTATITATSLHNPSKKAECKVTVVDAVVPDEPKTMTVTATDYSGTYDKQAHGISLNVTEPASGYTINYRTTPDGNYNLTTNPTFTDAGTYTVYYQVTSDGYNTATGSAKVVINKANAEIKFDKASLTITYGDTAPTNTLSNSGDGTVTYSSSNKAVAEVDSSGKVTIKGAGKATIKATVSNATNYTYGDKTEASYSLTVNPQGAVSNPDDYGKGGNLF